MNSEKLKQTNQPINMKYNYLLLCVLVLMAACGSPEGVSESEDSSTESDVGLAHVETLTLQPSLYEDVIVITGIIAAINDASLSAQSSGTVRMLAPLGQRVVGGTPVAKLEDALVRAVVDQTQAQWENVTAGLELATDNFQRLEPLHEDSIISALEFTQARTALRQAEAAVRQTEALLNQANEQLANTIIAAPFGGTVEQHFVETGEQVAPGISVIRIVDASQVKVSVGVPERYSGDLEVGREVKLNVAAYNQASRSGQITFVGSAIDPDSRTFPIEARVENADGSLKPEMIAEVHVVREQLDSVLVVPRTALVRYEAGSSLFVVQHSGGEPIVERRRVTTGSSTSGRIVITGGLAPGEEVIIRGQSVVSDGDRVTIDYNYSQLDDFGVPVAAEGSSGDQFPDEG